jgi:hypothetical protein
VTTAIVERERKGQIERRVTRKEGGGERLTHLLILAERR